MALKNTLACIALLLTLPVTAADRLLVTGQVVSRDAEVFVVPRTEGWQTQVKWMAEEGSVVKAGDLVAVFDSTAALNEIRQKEVELEQADQKAKDDVLKVERQLLDARHKRAQALLQVQRAKVETSVPPEHRSKFQNDEAALALERAERAADQARITLENLEKSYKVEKARAELDSKRITAELERRRDDLTRIELRASRGGPVIHGTHPWEGKKITTGTTVRPGWVIIEVPSSDAYDVEAWVNEVDAPLLREGLRVNMVLDAALDEAFTGKVTRLGKQAEQRQVWGNASYVSMRIQPDKLPKLPLTPGMSVRVEVPVGTQGVAGK